MNAPKFQNLLSAPPGGKFFYELEGRRVEGRCFQEIAPKVRALMARHGKFGSVEMELAAYMCPRLGPAASWYCTGDFGADPGVRSVEAYENSMPYTKRDVVPFDVIERRLERCLSCPKHRRDWCLTCTGHYPRMITAFGGRRPEIPVDRGTGVCMCARAYEVAVASVDYGNDKIWEGVPDTCWRKDDV